MAVEQVQMLREISHDIKTPKKRDTMESSNDFFERLAGDDDRNINEIESYEVITAVSYTHLTLPTNREV